MRAEAGVWVGTCCSIALQSVDQSKATCLITRHFPGAAAGDGTSLHDPAMSTPQAVAVELMCRCDEIPDEGVELQVLKGILTATTSATFTVHGQVGVWEHCIAQNTYLECMRRQAPKTPSQSEKTVQRFDDAALLGCMWAGPLTKKQFGTHPVEAL